MQFTDEGYRLVRCPTGDGAVPFKELFDILGQHNDTMLAAIEIGALEARHVRLFTPEWWHGYAPKQADGACRVPSRRAAQPARRRCRWRTPWERNADHELIDYELGQMRKSVANMKSLGLM